MEEKTFSGTTQYWNDKKQWRGNADITFQLVECASFLIQVSGHKHFLGNITASACLLSPEAISSTSNSFILMRKKFYSPALGISLEVDSANGEV